MMRGEARIGVRMECTRNREPSLRQSAHSGPIGPALLSPASECPAPESYHPIAKYAESAQVSRDRVVVEVTLYDRLEPFPRLPGPYFSQLNTQPTYTSVLRFVACLTTGSRKTRGRVDR